MSSIRPGRYVIRFCPQKGILGGGVATSQNKPDQPVKIEALSPDLLQWQNWAIMPGEVEDQWVIGSWNDGSVYGGVLSITDPTRPPAGPVITTTPSDVPGPSDKDLYWIVTPIEIDGENNNYTLRPATKAVGVDYYVGVQDDELYIQHLDIRKPGPKPYFQFISIGPE